MNKNKAAVKKKNTNCSFSFYYKKTTVAYCRRPERSNARKFPYIFTDQERGRSPGGPEPTTLGGGETWSLSCLERGADWGLFTGSSCDSL